jgi:hypothetical protein
VKSVVSAAFLACWVAVVACAGGKMKSAAAPSSGGAEPVSPMPGDPHNEIDRLAKAIDDELANAGVATSTPASCETAHTCNAEPYDVKPRVEDPTCKPASTSVCTQSCTLSDSVCDNAAKICKLATQLGGADAYANEKCQSGNESCKRTREKCCGC